MGVFIVTEADAAAIREAFDQGGELSAAVELRRRFPGITDNVRARDFARAVAGGQPAIVPPAPRQDAAAPSSCLMSAQPPDLGGAYLDMAWFKKCYFQVTPDPDKAAPAKDFRASSVTLI